MPRRMWLCALPACVILDTWGGLPCSGVGRQEIVLRDSGLGREREAPRCRCAGWMNLLAFAVGQRHVRAV